MKKFKLFLAVALFAITANAQNLLTNPGFEIWSAGVPTGWTLTPSAGGTVSQIMQDSLSSFQIAAPTGTYSISQFVLPPNGATTFDTISTYRISLSYLVTAGDGTDARVWSNLLTSAAGATAVNYVPSTHKDSTLYYLPLHGPGGNITPASGVCGNDSNGYLLDNRSSGIRHSFTYEFKFPAGITQFQFMVRSYKGSTLRWDSMFLGKVTVTDTQAPIPPTGLKNTEPNSNTFYLSWNASTDNVGVTEYEVYKDSTVYGSTDSLVMKISGLVSGETYKMTVRAKDAAGNLSAGSVPLLVSIPATGITYKVTVPAGTHTCYIVGMMNSWSPSANEMTRVDSTHFSITLPKASLTDEYKYCSGPDLVYVEKNATGGDIENRTYSASDVVLNWGAIYDPSVLPVEKDVVINVSVSDSVKICYLIGNFNNWTSPNDSSKMTKGLSSNGRTVFSKTIHTLDANKLQFKFSAGPALDYEQTTEANFTFPPAESSVTVYVNSFRKIFDPAKAGTIRINAVVPAGTERVWINGSHLGWNWDKPVEGIKNANGTFSFVIPNVEIVQYLLYNQPDWNHPEIAAGDSLAGMQNRVAEYPSDSITNINVWGWKQSVDSLIKSSITIDFGEGGFVYENNISLTSGENLEVNSGATGTFTIIPNQGYRVAKLVFNGEDVTSQIVNNQYSTPVINNAATLCVTFEKIMYRLSIKSAESGIVSLICEYGATPTFEFTPSENWKINAVLYDNKDVTSALSNSLLTVPPITTDVVLNISFVYITGLLSTSNSNQKVYSTDSGIVIEGLETGEIIRLYSENGAQLQILKAQGNRMVIPALPNAIYLVKTATKTVKVIL